MTRQRVVILGHLAGYVDAGERTAGHLLEIHHQFFARLAFRPVALQRRSISMTSSLTVLPWTSRTSKFLDLG